MSKSFLLAAIFSISWTALSMEVMQPYCLQFKDNATITLSSELYNSFDFFKCFANCNDQKNVTVLDCTTLTLPRYKKTGEEYDSVLEPLSYVWMQRLLEPFKKTDLEKAMICLRAYGFNELCTMVHDCHYLGLQNEKLDMVVSMLASKYVEQYKNNIVGRKYFFNQMIGKAFSEALSNLYNDLKQNVFNCKYQEGSVILCVNEDLMKYFSPSSILEGRISNLVMSLAFQKKKIVNNCLDLTACFDECFSELHEKIIVKLVDFEHQKNETAFYTVKKLILDQNATLNSLSIEMLCNVFPNLEAISAKESQLTNAVLSEEEKLAIMGVKSLEPLILKKPLTLCLGKDSHPVTLNLYREMGTYAGAVKFYCLLIKNDESTTLFYKKYDMWWKLLYLMRLWISVSYGLIYVPAKDLYSSGMCVAMPIAYCTEGFRYIDNKDTSLILMNNLVYISVMYDFFMHGPLTRSFIKSFVVKKICFDLIVYFPFLVNILWPLIKHTVINRQPVCPTIIVE